MESHLIPVFFNLCWGHPSSAYHPTFPLLHATSCSRGSDSLDILFTAISLFTATLIGYFFFLLINRTTLAFLTFLLLILAAFTLCLLLVTATLITRFSLLFIATHIISICLSFFSHIPTLFLVFHIDRFFCRFMLSTRTFRVS